ncbi:MAG: ATP-binding protein [Pirellula sp.]
MDWETFVGHHRQRGWFANAARQERLASTFLMVGPSGIGKRTFARLVAKSLLCTRYEPTEFATCGACEACVQIEAGTHPDLIEIKREKDKSNLSMEQLVGSDESRMREGLCYEIRMRPYSGRRKIAIVDDVDTLAVEGANSLLKTLEEPPPGALIFLIGTSEQRQLRTIRSRSQIVRFAPLAQDELALLIQRHGLADNSADALRLARQSHGSLQLAAQVRDESMSEFRALLIESLDSKPIDFPRLSKSITEHLESVAPDGQARRDQLKWVLDIAIDLYRESMRYRLGIASVLDTAIHPTPSEGVTSRNLQRLAPETLGALIQRTQQAREQVDRNVSPAALVEAWVTEVTGISRA